jgi:hypothetical protein
MAKQNPRSLGHDSSYFTRLGMEVELRNLEEKAAQIRAWLGRTLARGPGRPPAPTDGASSHVPAGRRRRKRTMSADARRRISEAQKARWAKQRGQQAPAPDEAPAGTAVAAAKAKRGRRGSAKRGRKAKG